MGKKKNKVFLRLTTDFVVSIEENERIKSRYVAIRDKEDKEITSSELSFIGYENEEGEECDEDGNLLNQ